MRDTSRERPGPSENQDTNSLQYQKCSIEFLIILNYPAITNIFAINQIIRYNGVFAIRRSRHNEHFFFGTVAATVHREESTNEMCAVY